MSKRRVLITGSTGFLGAAVCARLRQDPQVELLASGVDLRDVETARLALRTFTPDAVIHLAYPGGDGIGDALARPATLAADLLRMDLNIIQATAEARIPKLVCIGSVCSYPEHTILPTDEAQLWAGYPEPVNASYGVVKRTQLMLLQAYRQETGLHGIHLILPNLYGPGDRSGHVIPALITRMRLAVRDGQQDVVIWGGPEVTRSFLYIADAAEGIVRALERYDQPEPLNLVSGEEVSMRRLADHLARRLGYRGEFHYDTTKPTGHIRRWFSQQQMQAALDWLPQTSFATGLDATVAWHLAQAPRKDPRP